MNVTALNSLTELGKLGLNSTSTPASATVTKNSTFDNMFKSSVNLLNDTNNYTQAAQQEETKYALGITDSTHDLQVAQQKANLALQYTVAIRNNVMDAYKDIMNLQF